MKVLVRPINLNGRPEFKKQRERREAYQGDLKVFHELDKDVRRHVIKAQVLNSTDNVGAIMREMHDVVLLWLDGRSMRLRGFEIADGVQYAQTWEVEVLG